MAPEPPSWFSGNSATRPLATLCGRREQTTNGLRLAAMLHPAIGRYSVFLHGDCTRHSSSPHAPPSATRSMRTLCVVTGITCGRGQSSFRPFRAFIHPSPKGAASRVPTSTYHQSTTSQNMQKPRTWVANANKYGTQLTMGKKPTREGSSEACVPYKAYRNARICVYIWIIHGSAMMQLLGAIHAAPTKVPEMHYFSMMQKRWLPDARGSRIILLPASHKDSQRPTTSALSSRTRLVCRSTCTGGADACRCVCTDTWNLSREVTTSPTREVHST